MLYVVGQVQILQILAILFRQQGGTTWSFILTGGTPTGAAPAAEQSPQCDKAFLHDKVVAQVEFGQIGQLGAGHGELDDVELGLFS